MKIFFADEKKTLKSSESHYKQRKGPKKFSESYHTYVFTVGQTLGLFIYKPSFPFSLSLSIYISLYWCVLFSLVKNCWKIFFDWFLGFWDWFGFFLVWLELFTFST